MKWQPIETAPRDGTFFVATWAGDYSTPYIVYIGKDGDTYDYMNTECRGPFTHWMPLPNPPEPPK